MRNGQANVRWGVSLEYGSIERRQLPRADAEEDSIESKAGETHHLGYGEPGGDIFALPGAGLLTSMRDPRGEEWTFEHDAYGRLLLDQDPAGGHLALEREDEAEPGEGVTADYTVTLTTALGRPVEHRVKQLTGGGLERRVTAADGLATYSERDPGGSVRVEHADGTRTTSLNLPGTLAESRVELPAGLSALESR